VSKKNWLHGALNGNSHSLIFPAFYRMWMFNGVSVILTLITYLFNIRLILLVNLRVPWNAGKLSRGLTSSGLSISVQLHIVS
jgi:uncharacterized membrane protein (DUF485 family)